MKYEIRKPGTRKGVAALVALVLILCVTIGGTLAWITAQTNAVTNTFTPATVSVDIDEQFDGTTKSNITVRNEQTDSNIPAYIRAAVVVNWVNSENHVVPGPDFDLPTTLGQNWVLNTTDGYYYYTSVVDPGKSTSSLFGNAEITEPSNKPNGARLQVTILAEAIQAAGETSNGTKAVVDAWGVDPSTLKPTTNS